ncbi:hypothetical protein ASD40_04605 [Paenibacillus sp. Root444D2]|nr:hypothetical protein ASD40_04605 [Paenibacillus sp. Root444D2]
MPNLRIMIPFKGDLYEYCNIWGSNHMKFSKRSANIKVLLRFKPYLLHTYKVKYIPQGAKNHTGRKDRDEK